MVMNLNNGIVILYDGYCNLCNTSLQFIIKHDKKREFQYIPLQSEEADELLPNNITKENLPDSVILIEDGQMYSKSEAFFRILPYLGKRYKFLLVFKIIPQKLRDRIYDWIASNRYKWFGKKDKCGL